jgi:hypothetical protein
MSTEPREPDETTEDIGQQDEATAAMPVAEPEPTGRDGAGRRWTVVAVAAIVAVVAAAITLAVMADGSDDTTTSASTTVATTSEATTSSTGVTTTTEPTTSSTGATTTDAPAVTNPPVTTAPSGPELPRDPNGYATAAFLAWQQGDDATLELLTSPAALAVLTARAPGTGDWTGPICDGAAGSSYCTWNGLEDQLVLRVANEAASTGQAHAVHEARFQASSS